MMDKISDVTRQDIIDVIRNHFLAFPAQMCYHYKQRCQVWE